MSLRSLERRDAGQGIERQSLARMLNWLTDRQQQYGEFPRELVDQWAEMHNWIDKNKRERSTELIGGRENELFSRKLENSSPDPCRCRRASMRQLIARCCSTNQWFLLLFMSKRTDAEDRHEMKSYRQQRKKGIHLDLIELSQHARLQWYSGTSERAKNSTEWVKCLLIFSNSQFHDRTGREVDLVCKECSNPQLHRRLSNASCKVSLLCSESAGVRDEGLSLLNQSLRRWMMTHRRAG